MSWNLKFQYNLKVHNVTKNLIKQYLIKHWLQVIQKDKNCEKSKLIKTILVKKLIEIIYEIGTRMQSQGIQNGLREVRLG